MIVKKKDIESLYSNLNKLRVFYAHKHNIHEKKVNFIIQSTVIFVMIDNENVDIIREIKELTQV
jgi:hypothetical protein